MRVGWTLWIKRVYKQLKQSIMKYYFLIAGLMFIFGSFAFVSASFMVLEPTAMHLFVICVGFASLFLGGVAAIVHYKTILENEENN